MVPKSVQDPEVEAVPMVDEADADLEAWTPEDFDHCIELGLLRAPIAAT